MLGLFLFCSLLTPLSSGQSGSDSVLKVSVGNMAPDFTLKDQRGDKVSLSTFRGKKNVVLAFFVFAFSSGCAEELQALGQQLPKDDVQVLAVSMDSVFANGEFASQLGIHYPVLSDKDGAVTRRYGLYNPVTHTSRRATILIGKKGKILDIQLDHNALTPKKTNEALERLKGKLVY